MVNANVCAWSALMNQCDDTCFLIQNRRLERFTIQMVGFVLRWMSSMKQPGILEITVDSFTRAPWGSCIMTRPETVGREECQIPERYREKWCSRQESEVRWRTRCALRAWVASPSRCVRRAIVSVYRVDPFRANSKRNALPGDRSFKVKRKERVLKRSDRFRLTAY